MVTFVSLTETSRSAGFNNHMLFSSLCPYVVTYNKYMYSCTHNNFHKDSGFSSQGVASLWPLTAPHGGEYLGCDFFVGDQVRDLTQVIIKCCSKSLEQSAACHVCHRLSLTVSDYHRLCQTATGCLTLSQTASHCHRLSHTVTYCLTQSQAVSHCHRLPHTVTGCLTLSQTASHCHRLSHTVTDCLRLSQAVSHCHILSQAVTDCLRLSHTVTDSLRLSQAVSDCLRLSHTVTDCLKL